MPAQTSYTIEHGVAYEGGRADSAPMHAVAGLNKSGATIPFGRGVTFDAANMTGLGPNSVVPVKLPTVNTDKFVGIMLADAVHLLADAGVLDGKVGSVLTKGTVYVIAEDAVDPSSAVFLRVIANGAGTASGQFRGTADGVNTVAVANARFRGKVAAGEIVAIELNNP